MPEFESIVAESLRIFLQIAIPLTAAPLCVAAVVAVIGKFINFSDEAIHYGARAISIALVMLALGAVFFSSMQGLFQYTFAGGL